MMMPTFSVSIKHQARSLARQRALASMCDALAERPGPEIGMRIFDEAAEGPWNEWQHKLHDLVWRWHLGTGATHHVLLTDDLWIAPRFWWALLAMVSVKPEAIIGLLSNHPAAVPLAERGAHWYRTNSWLVGPAIIIPQVHLANFVEWHPTWLASVNPKDFGDDSAMNVWVTLKGPGQVCHPLPTLIEHRGDIESTWCPGDCYSRERVSWRHRRSCPLGPEYRGLWTSVEVKPDIEALCTREFWDVTGPLLNVSGASEKEAEKWHP